eukprot:546654-Rhodomonas_salina.1
MTLRSQSAPRGRQIHFQTNSGSLAIRSLARLAGSTACRKRPALLSLVIGRKVTSQRLEIAVTEGTRVPGTRLEANDTQSLARSGPCRIIALRSSVRASEPRTYTHSPMTRAARGVSGRSSTLT